MRSRRTAGRGELKEGPKQTSDDRSRRATTEGHEQRSVALATDVASSVTRVRCIARVPDDREAADGTGLDGKARKSRDEVEVAARLGDLFRRRVTGRPLLDEGGSQGGRMGGWPSFALLDPTSRLSIWRDAGRVRGGGSLQRGESGVERAWKAYRKQQKRSWGKLRLLKWGGAGRGGCFLTVH